jgi:hypothetical protein
MKPLIKLKNLKEKIKMLTKLGMFYKELADLLDKYNYSIKLDADNVIRISILEKTEKEKFDEVAYDEVVPYFYVTSENIIEQLMNAGVAFSKEGE